MLVLSRHQPARYQTSAASSQDTQLLSMQSASLWDAHAGHMQVVLSGQGRNFCAGIDLELVGVHSEPDPSGCPGRKVEFPLITVGGVPKTPWTGNC